MTPPETVLVLGVDETLLDDLTPPGAYAHAAERVGDLGELAMRLAP